MNCPHCGNFVPDANFRCPTCHKAVQETVDPTVFRDRSAKRFPMNATSLVFALLIIGVVLLAAVLYFKSQAKKSETSPETGRVVSAAEKNRANRDSGTTEAQPEPEGTPGELKMGSVINKDNPGQVIQIEEYVQGDQITIFDFYSEYCPPCMTIAPWLKELDKIRDDIVVQSVDINRPDYTGIDFYSPLSTQYNLKSVPHFIIFSNGGIRDMEGREAYTYIMKLLQKEGIIQQ